jgi:LytS/YehU family sensor histidine kinase
MGLLFSSLLVILAVAIFAMFSFFVALFFQPPAWAIRSAAMFVVGTASGVILSGAVSLLVVGVGATFISSSQVVAYLSSLALGGLLGGSLLLWLFIKARRSNPSFKRDWLKPAP